MIRWTSIKAVSAGIAVLILAQVLYLGVLLQIKHYDWLGNILHYFPGIAACTTSILAPHKKIVLGISVSVWGAALAILSTSAYVHMGFYADSIGGPLATFLIVLGYYFILSVIGSILGCYASHYKSIFK